jgi:predicted nucleotidyltransferase
VASTAHALLQRLATDISAALGGDLLGLYVHGSYACGDFDPDRSDLDLLAVLATDPTTGTLAVLRRMHRQIATENAAWADRIEVQYVSSAALSDFRTDPRPMLRISPGEPLHMGSATGHYLLTWYAARTRGLALRGPAPDAVIPAIGADEFRAAVVEHAIQWPEWVLDHHTVGAQAYAVLTLCRALVSVSQGRDFSKRQAARYGSENLPRWADLIRWAEAWWYHGGSDSAPGRLPEVIRFVREISAQIVTESAHNQSGS